MDLEIIILSEVSQTETNTIYCLYVESKKIIQMNLQNRNSITDVENKLMVTGGEGRWGGEGRDKLGDWDWHIHITVYKVDN